MELKRKGGSLSAVQWDAISWLLLCGQFQRASRRRLGVEEENPKTNDAVVTRGLQQFAVPLKLSTIRPRDLAHFAHQSPQPHVLGQYDEGRAQPLVGGDHATVAAGPDC